MRGILLPSTWERRWEAQEHVFYDVLRRWAAELYAFYDVLRRWEALRRSEALGSSRLRILRRSEALGAVGAPETLLQVTLPSERVRVPTPV